MDDIHHFHVPTHDWITDAYNRLWSRSEDFTEERHGLTVLTCCPPNLSASGQVVAVRDEYLQLWDFLHDAHNKKYFGGLVLTGHPGTGKYCFLLYAFARALRERISVAYCDSPDEYYFCDGTGCRVYPTSHFVEHETEPGKFFLALVDSNDSIAIPPHAFINRAQMCFTVHATSPDPERYYHWAKERDESRYWTMSLWTEDEVRKLQHFYEQEGPCPWHDTDTYYSPLEVFSLLGPSASTCFNFSPRGNRKTALGPTHDFHDLLRPADVFNRADDLLAASTRRAVAPSPFARFFFGLKPHGVRNPMVYGPQLHHAVPTHFLARLLSAHFRRRSTAEQLAFLAALHPCPHATSFVYEPAILDTLCAPASQDSEPVVTCHLADGSAFALGPGLVLADRQVDTSESARIELRAGHIYVLRDLSPWINAFVLSVSQDADSDSDTDADSGCTWRVTMLQTTVSYCRTVSSSAVRALIALVRRSLPNSNLNTPVEEGKIKIKWSFVFVSPGANGEEMARRLGTVKFRQGCPAPVVAGWLDVGALLPLAREVVDALKRDDAGLLDEKLDDYL